MKRAASNDHASINQLPINSRPTSAWTISYRLILLTIFICAVRTSTPLFDKSLGFNRELQNISNGILIEKIKVARETNNNIKGPAPSKIHEESVHNKSYQSNYLVRSFVNAMKIRKLPSEPPSVVSKNHTTTTTPRNDHISSQKVHTRETEYMVIEDEESAKEIETCSPVGGCTLCKDKSEPSCDETGRATEYICISKHGHVKDEAASKRRKEYRSCTRTTADEEYLLLQMEFFLLILGLLSTVFSKFQKKRSVSLFDQRWSKKVRQSSLAFTFQPGMLGVDEDLSSKLNNSDNYDDLSAMEIEPLMSSTKQNGKSTLHNRTSSSGRLNDDDSIQGDGVILVSSSSDHGIRELEMV